MKGCILKLENEVVRISNNNSVVVKTKNSNSKSISSITKENLQKIYDNFDKVDDIKSLNQLGDLEINTRQTNTFAVFHGLKEYEKQYAKNPEQFDISINGIDENEIIRMFENGVFREAVIKYGNEVEKFVLIIDEINRGNVSQILGELITLIEEDKRLGEKEFIELILPYSKTKFSVPPNLYIIGTMNTADRSVEALDTALRRRFGFIEMFPKYNLIQNTVEGINLSELLENINLRIEKLLDKDHQIGHSYFMKIETIEILKNVFHNNIIPLLQEYFFGDFGKIGLVLGNGFVSEKENNNDIFAEFNYDNKEDFLEKVIYEIKNVNDMNNEQFKEAIKSLLKS